MNQTTGKPSSINDLFTQFCTPPAHARPFVRWWWNNNQIEEKELIRELDLLKDAGFGGVEINPINEPYLSWDGVVLSSAEIIEWRSKKWDTLLYTAAKAAKERGMITDLTGGSSWPFGGDFIPKSLQVQRVSIFRDEVKGPVVYSIPITEMFTRKRDYGFASYRKEPVNPSLYRVWLHPVKMKSLQEVRDITDSVDETGILLIDIPDGEYIVAYGIHERSFRLVSNAVKGGEGAALDHFQKEAIQRFMDTVIGAEKTWGEPLSHYIRAIFCDSIEIGEANWTDDSTETFTARKGYDITPYLPFIIREEEDCIDATEECAEEIRRARYDWTEHNIALFHERFTSEFVRICAEHSLLSRFQAYGNPTLVGMAEGYMLPDIPEGNNVIYSYQHGPYSEDYFTWKHSTGDMIWNKYAAAGGALHGRHIISCEAMTNVLGLFHTTMGTLKQSDDMNFITGITHSILHGFNYVPPDISFPGLIRFGTFFSEYNPWWKYIHLWVEYNARLSTVFQATAPAGDIALLGPAPDIWAKDGMRKGPFHMTPPYFHRLWEPVSQLGYNCDYLHSAVINNAIVKDGRIVCGEMSYKVLLIVDMESIEPATAESLQSLTEQGGMVIFVNQVPSRAPGLADAETQDARVKNAIEKTLKEGTVCVPAPEDEAHYREWLLSVLATVDFVPEIHVVEPRDGLFCIRYHGYDEDFIFFTNTYRHESSHTRVEYSLGSRGLWRWNPEKGERTPYPCDEKGFDLHLRPLESILLVTGEKQQAQSELLLPETATEIAKKTIDTSWKVTCIPADGSDSFVCEMNELCDFTEHADSRLHTFGGMAIYSTTFDIQDETFDYLDIGEDNDFVSDIELNGQKTGVNWYGSRMYDISTALRTGKNTLVIRYATPLWNMMLSSDYFAKLIQKWGQIIQQSRQSAGLIGPVQLVRCDE